MKKTALIIGGAGFVGSYLAEYLHDECGYFVNSTKLANETLDSPYGDVYDLNILDQEQIEQLLTKMKPDCIFHLAAQSSVAVSWKRPQLTVDINVKGVVNLLEALKNIQYKGRTLLIGSGEEYGMIREDECPVTEDNVLRPGNIYAATKSCQNLLGAIYAKAYQLDIMMVRAFNHIGPNQIPQFVVADFCSQVAAIEKGLQKPEIRVGNLSAKRDFTDVRDVVAAYGAIVEKGCSGETYNVGSGHAVAIQDILDEILSLSERDIQVIVDQSKFRPVDVPVIEADISKIQKDTSWKPQISLRQTLVETMEYWRNHE